MVLFDRSDRVVEPVPVSGRMASGEVSPSFPVVEPFGQSMQVPPGGGGVRGGGGVV